MERIEYPYVDAAGHEQWIVGFVEERQQREDGEWCYCVPSDAGMWASEARAKWSRWVRSDQVRPWKGPRRRRRR